LKGEPRYDELEKRLFQKPAIGVSTITMNGDANGAPHPEPAAYAKMFSGKYSHRTITGGSGTICPRKRRKPSPKRSSTSLLKADRCDGPADWPNRFSMLAAAA
jgi:hypothetical protein